MKRVLLYCLFLFVSISASFNLNAQHVGRLYGLTYGGGTSFNQYGTFFYFDSINNKDSIILNYVGNNGENPYGAVIQANDGKLYGVTAYGGSNGGRPYGGTLFRYDAGSGQYDILHNFPDDNMDAEVFYGGLFQAKNDTIYGLSFAGQTCSLCAGSGTLYSFDPVSIKDTVLVALRSATTGSKPQGNLIQATNGLLYGCGYFSRSNGPGTIFQYSIDSDIARIDFIFNGTDGANPRGSLLQVNDSMLYGLTFNGGSNSMGVLFSFNINSKVETVLHNFTGYPNDGANPGGSLMQASDGNLYGMDTAGGNYDHGVLFRYDPISNGYTVIYNFKGNATDGGTPFADVIQASDGQLWGMTNLGGTYNYGTIFAYNLTTNVEKVMVNFDTLNGNWPYGDLLEIFDATVTVTNNICSNGTTGALVITETGGRPPFTYSWSNGATTSSISGLTSGTYTCSITDSRGISFSFKDTVKPFPCSVTFVASNACSGDSNGSATALVSGGTGPFTYQWSNGETTDTAINLPNGTYSCTVINALGCPPGIGTVTISQSAPLVINSIVVTPQTWPSYNGIITVTVSGGIPPGDPPCYHYLWSNGAPDSSIVYNLDTGTYAVCITSCYGCGSVCDSNLVIMTDAIKDINNPNNLIKVYPVPSSGLITINMKGTGFENMEITDALGRQIYNQMLSPQLKDNTIHVDLSTLSDGVYILHINSQHGLLNRKIIIQK